MITPYELWFPDNSQTEKHTPFYYGAKGVTHFCIDKTKNYISHTFSEKWTLF